MAPIDSTRTTKWPGRDPATWIATIARRNLAIAPAKSLASRVLMSRPMKQRVLTQHLRPLRDVELDTLARVTGGESASTSTSGTPSAGDETIGDCSINNLRQISLAVW